MKYVAIFIAVVLAFIAGTQISRANTFDLHTGITHHQTALTDYMASEWLVPDNAHRMIAYHEALLK